MSRPSHRQSRCHPWVTCRVALSKLYQLPCPGCRSERGPGTLDTYRYIYGTHVEPGARGRQDREQAQAPAESAHGVGRRSTWTRGRWMVPGAWFIAVGMAYSGSRRRRAARRANALSHCLTGPWSCSGRGGSAFGPTSSRSSRTAWAAGVIRRTSAGSGVTSVRNWRWTGWSVTPCAKRRTCFKRCSRLGVVSSHTHRSGQAHCGPGLGAFAGLDAASATWHGYDAQRRVDEEFLRPGRSG